MSTTSRASTLVACDSIPGDEVELLNCMCVLVLTWGDGTPFDAASMQEDIIEICIQLGQTHPEGVLLYSAVEWVILFHSTDEMLVTACGVIKAMALYEEPIRLRMSPPSATHVRAFMAARNGEPLGAQPPTPDMEEDPKPSPSDPHPDGKTPHQLQVNLGDLEDAELQQLMEDLCWEVALRELNVTQGPTTNPQGEI